MGFIRKACEPKDKASRNCSLGWKWLLCWKEETGKSAKSTERKEDGRKQTGLCYMVKGVRGEIRSV